MNKIRGFVNKMKRRMFQPLKTLFFRWTRNGHPEIADHTNLQLTSGIPPNFPKTRLRVYSKSLR